MPTILIYLLKVNIALLLFCLCYYAILRRLTFYTLNRVYLITAILFSSVYPLIDFTGLFARSEKLVQPIQAIVITLNMRAASFAKPVAQTNYWEWLVIIFWIGVVMMALRLAIQFLSLLSIYCRSKPANLYNHQVRVINDEANPFSFWQSIYINPQHHSSEELKSIIAHEQVHVNQWHTLDILLAELSLVFYWFNPGVWLIKKAVSENLEFITDSKILKQGIDAKSYQYSLLYTSFNTSPNAMVNHFNISTIKKRIMMMNTKKSSAFSLTRYGFIAPAVLVLLLAFGTTKAAYLKKGFTKVKDVAHQVIALTGIKINAKPDHQIAYNKAKPAVKLISVSKLTDTNRVKIRGSFSYTPDTPKSKINSVHLTGPDTGYYVLNGKHITPKQMLEINPGDIVSMHIIGAPSAGKVFGAEANNGAVFITSKDGENTSIVKDLLTKINAIKATGTSKETGIYAFNPPKGSVNAITITSNSDSAYKSVPGYVSSSYTHTSTATKNIKGIASVGSKDAMNITLAEPNIATTVTYSSGKGYVTANDALKLASVDPSFAAILKSASGKGYIDAADVIRASKINKVRINGTTYNYPLIDSISRAAALNFRHEMNSIHDPLFILDGKKITRSKFENIDQSKLQQINVLKDKAATQIYGDKGANGVVIITTKKSEKTN